MIAPDSVEDFMRREDAGGGLKQLTAIRRSVLATRLETLSSEPLLTSEEKLREALSCNEWFMTYAE